MLVLARGVGECIMIGHDIRVRIVSVSGDVVRIGIEAPASIDVHREEVYLEIQEANEFAVRSTSRPKSAK